MVTQGLREISMASVECRMKEKAQIRHGVKGRLRALTTEITAPGRAPTVMEGTRRSDGMARSAVLPHG